MSTQSDEECRKEPLLGDLLEDAVRSFLRDADGIGTGAGVDLLQRPPRAVVVDANRLRGEIRAIARNGHDTALATLARAGFLHVFAARHVFDEVDRHLARWARETSTPLPACRAAWDCQLRPLINEVSFPRGLLTPDELARIEQLNRPHPLGDPDDVPTAIAAMVLEAPLLSGDQKALEAVYGPDVEPGHHDAYRDALFGGGRVLVLSQMGQVTLMLVQLVGGLGTAGVRALGSRTGALPLAIGTAAAAAWALSTEQTRAWLPRMKEPLRGFGAGLLEIYAFYRKAEVDYSQLEAPVLNDLDALPHHVKAARDAARQTALEDAGTAMGATRTDG